MRGIIAATFLLVTSAVYAGHPAGGIQVLVNRGGATVFKGITDSTGQFTTDTLEPGEYQVEVRGPKVVPPVRYFLILSGARPMGQTLTNAGGDLALQAQVRRPVSIRGQVSSSRIIVLNNPAGAAATPSSSSAAANVRPITQPAPAESVRSPAGAAPMSKNASPTIRSSTTTNTAAAARPIGAATATAGSTNARLVAATTQSAPPAANSATPATGAPQSRVIDGKLCVWVPSAPGSKLGRWVPVGPAAASQGTSAATGARAPQTNAGTNR